MRTTLGGLDCVISQAKEGPPKLAVILCHGYGAPGDDLVALAPALVRSFPALADVRFIFPRGPLSLDFVMGDARAWWPIDMERLLQHHARGEDGMAELRRVEPEGMAASRAALKRLIEEVTRAKELPLSRVVLGGFSQGAMLSTDVALGLEEAPAGLAILSGTLLKEPVWRQQAARRKGLPVFQSHGRADGILAFSAATALEQLLKEAGLDVAFHPFDDAHTIPPTTLGALGEWLLVRRSRAG